MGCVSAGGVAKCSPVYRNCFVVMRIAVLFDDFGPYHLARLKAASQVCTLMAIEVRRRSVQYPWDSVAPLRGFRHVRVLEDPLAARPKWSSKFHALRRELDRSDPGCVFIPGWSNPSALAVLNWSMSRRVPVVLMSESTTQDQERSLWKEWLKARIVSMCSASLVGGKPQTEYLVRLGMAPERVFQGYDIVDNDYFGRSTHEVRKWKAAFRDGFRLPEQYFLASARFVPSKNLPCLIRAYALYRAALHHLTNTPKRTLSDRPWSLVILGDGAERPALQTLIAELGLDGDVLLPGFEHYRALPAYYGLAGAFVHASRTEPWGLVVNEAMASRLPVLVSNRCGCAPDLVHDGRNGFTFDPTNVEELAKLMLKMSRLCPDRLAMGDISGEVVAVWGPNRFGDGLRRAAEKAIESKAPTCTVWRKVLALARIISRPRPRRRTY